MVLHYCFVKSLVQYNCIYYLLDKPGLAEPCMVVNQQRPLTSVFANVDPIDGHDKSNNQGIVLIPEYERSFFKL